MDSDRQCASSIDQEILHCNHQWQPHHLSVPLIYTYHNTLINKSTKVW